ncbi:MAG: MYG1 family protein [Candidatus Nomurabacteria bacterium]|nr:MYG1 family protein [Candidatus Nomurabacteria bacterium]
METKSKTIHSNTSVPMVKLVTHNGSFHADDVFAAATLSLMLEKKGESFEIIRTRNHEIIKEGDYVFDVGGTYDADANRFDHHQIGGAGKRPVLPSLGGENGIEYASFGLVWKKFGKELTGSDKIVELIDKHIAIPIDASDNGFDLVESKYNALPYSIQHFFESMSPTWRETNITDDEIFLKCIEIAKIVLSREIIQARDSILAEEKVISIYQKATDKRIIVLDENYPYQDILDNLKELLFIIYPRTNDNLWGVKAARKNKTTFKNRKDFPKSWAGLRDEELQKVTGVSDAVFCHKALFLAVAKSKEGAIKLAELALSV